MSNKIQKFFKVIMLILLVAIITWTLTITVMYKKLGVISITSSTNNSDITKIASTLAKFKTIIDKEYLGEIKEEDLINGAVKGYIEALGDPYTEYLTEEEMNDLETYTSGNYVGIGVYIGANIEENKIVVISPIKDSPAEKAGIKAGDIILKVDDKTYEAKELTDASNNIKGKEGTKVKLEILRDNETLNFEIERKVVKLQYISGTVIENDIGYIAITSFDEEAAKDFTNTYNELKEKNIKSLIIDLRDNGGGVVDEALKITDMFLEKDKTMLITVDKNNNKKYSKTKSDKTIDIPVIILANDASASASEIFIGALKDNERSKVVGTTTFGKGLIQQLRKMQNGTGLKVTIAEYFTPNENPINKKGIEPDYKVEIEGNKDTQLQKAIELLK